MLSNVSALRWGKPWMTNAILCLLGYGLLMMARQFVSETDHFTLGFSGVSGYSVWLYLASLAVVLTQPVDRKTIYIVLGFALLQQWMTLFEPPYLSSDIYRYVWDGIVQHAGINPYRYIPAEKALTFLQAQNQDIYDNINRKEYARTIYPPVAQMLYWLSTFLSPTVQGMKFTMFLAECGTCTALMAMLRRMRRPVAEVLIFAWCPLLVWEIAGAGHVDAAVFFFIALAMLFRFRNQPVWVGVFLGLAIMTKFYPLVLFPALWTRRDWKMPAAIAAVVAVGYALYSSVGKLVVGFLFQYQKEEGMDSGSRYFLLDWINAHHVPLGKAEYMIFCVLVFAAITWWCWKNATVESVPTEARSTPAFVKGTMWLALALMLLFSPHYPWYLAWLIPLMTVWPNWVAVFYVCSFFYGYTTRFADGTPANSLLLNGWIYAVVLAAMVVQLAWSRWPLGQRTLCRREESALARD